MQHLGLRLTQGPGPCPYFGGNGRVCVATTKKVAAGLVLGIPERPERAAWVLAPAKVTLLRGMLLLMLTVGIGIEWALVPGTVLSFTCTVKLT